MGEYGFSNSRLELFGRKVGVTLEIRSNSGKHQSQFLQKGFSFCVLFLASSEDPDEMSHHAFIV